MSTSFFSFCIVVSFSLTNFFNSLSSYSCMRAVSLGTSFSCLSLYVWEIVLLFWAHISWIFLRISLIVSVALAIKVYLATFVRTSKSPQLTSSISNLSTVHLAFQSSCSLFSISSFYKKVIDVFYGNSFLIIDEWDF